MKKLIQQLAAMARYGIDCGDCGLPADVGNAACEDHKPYHPSDPDDAEQTLNSLIDQARAIVYPSVTVIISSLEGVKIEVHPDKVMRYEMDFSNGPEGQWLWHQTYNLHRDLVLFSLLNGLNEVDKTAAIVAIRKAKEALDGTV